jgi:hypothetical protein
MDIWRFNRFEFDSNPSKFAPLLVVKILVAAQCHHLAFDAPWYPIAE